MIKHRCPVCAKTFENQNIYSLLISDKWKNEKI